MLTILLMLAAQAGADQPKAATEQWPSLRAPAIVDQPDWSDSSLYPMAAREKNEEGRVVPQVLVGADGKPQACRIVTSSNLPELDAGSCDLMMRMRFEPARDSNGTKVQSSYSREMIWILTDPRPFASSRLRVRESISGGRQRTCEILSGEGPYLAPWSALACPLLRDVRHYFGARAGDTLSAIVEFRLNAWNGSGSPVESSASGPLIAADKLSFVVDEDGDPAMCTLTGSRGFGPRDVVDTSPCDDLLRLLWFSPAAPGTPQQQGTFETRVYLVSDTATD